MKDFLHNLEYVFLIFFSILVALIFGLSFLIMQFLWNQWFKWSLFFKK